MKQTNKMLVKTATENWLFVFGLLSVIQQTGTKQTSTRRNNIAECRQMETPQRLWAVFRQSHNFSDQIFSIKATYYAYYFSWLYTSFPESESKQALECSIWNKNTFIYVPPLETDCKKLSENKMVHFDIWLHTCSFDLQWDFSGK